MQLHRLGTVGGRGCRMGLQAGVQAVAAKAGSVLLPAVPYLLMASRGGSCPSNEVQYGAQPGAGFKQKEGVGGGKKTLDCGADFMKQPPCCSSTAILCVLPQEGIKLLDPVRSRSTETGDKAGGICREQL